MMKSRTLAEFAIKLAEQPNAEQELKRFLGYIEAHNLSGILPQVLDHVRRLTASASSDSVLRIFSRYELTKKDIDNIRSTTGAPKDVVVEETCDPSVVGGFKATYQGHMYDGSLHHQVTRLKTTLTR